jgi:hypothetical protein
VLAHARTRRVWGEIRMQGPSRFLDDLPASSVANPVGRRVITPRAPAIIDGNWTALRRSPRSSRDDLDQRVPDDEPVYRVDDDLVRPGVFRTGDAVEHVIHGRGRVVAVSGSGKDSKVIVEFPNAGRKTVFAEYLRATDDGAVN